MDFTFLKSLRFWKVVLAFVFQALGFYGVVPAEIANTISGILGVDVLIRTVDRSFELLSEK